MVAVLIPLRPNRFRSVASGKATLVAGAFAVTLPWWPTDISWDSLADSWSEIPRPGNDPLLVRDARTLPEVRIGFLAATREGESVQKLLDDLRVLAGLSSPAQLMLGARDAGVYRVTDLSIVELDHVDGGDCSRADVELVLKEAVDASAPLGPIKPKKKRRRSKKRGR